jgi:O-acetyl-ADP-ribose deacetylase (regulator of RNase III)
MPTKIFFVKGDITEMAVDSIVNATSTDLLMDSGVAAAILRKGGARIQEECERLAPLRLGAAAATPAGSLKAYYVIHAAIARPDEKATAESVRLATRESLLRAEEKTIKSLALPPLGTGEGAVPVEACAQTMLKVVLDHVKMHTSLEKIYFVFDDDTALKVFDETHHKMTARSAA